MPCARGEPFCEMLETTFGLDEVQEEWMVEWLLSGTSFLYRCDHQIPEPLAVTQYSTFHFPSLYLEIVHLKSDCHLIRRRLTKGWEEADRPERL
jgi:hypothetical protein